MVNTRFICNILENLGFIDLHENETKVRWKAHVHAAFMFVNTFVICFTAVYHLFITFTRATRYAPEFFECLFEDAFICTASFVVLYMRTNHKQVLDIVQFMEKEFSIADGKIIRKNNYQCKVLFIVIAFLNLGAVVTNVLESLLPLSEKEVEIKKRLFGKQNPQRRLAYHIQYLMVDESQPTTFPVCFVLSLYQIFVFACILVLISNCIPITLLHLKAQYVILTKYVENIGKRHTDSNGAEIFYIDIVKREIRYVDMRSMRGKWHLHLARRIYERDYLKQIVRHHQKLVLFQGKVCDLGVFQDM